MALREKDSAREAQKDMLALRTEAAVSRSTRVPELPQWWDVRCLSQPGGSWGVLGAGSWQAPLGPCWHHPALCLGGLNLVLFQVG